MAEIKMIKVENSEFEEKQIGNRYSDLMVRCLKSNPAKGLTVDQMISQKDLIKYLRESKDNTEIELSPSQIRDITEKINNYPWAVHSDELCDMVVYLRSL